jgi:hypothetical protein
LGKEGERKASEKSNGEFRTDMPVPALGTGLGHSRNNASNLGEQVNPVNPSLSRALSAFDLTRNFVVNYKYQLPFAKFLPANRLTNGWSLSGISRFSTGFPVTLVSLGDNSLLGADPTASTTLGSTSRTSHQALSNSVITPAKTASSTSIRRCSASTRWAPREQRAADFFMAPESIITTWRWPKPCPSRNPRLFCSESRRSTPSITPNSTEPLR